MTDGRPPGIPAAEERPNLGRLLADPYLALTAELHERLAAAGFGDVRPAHGVVFAVIDAEGTRVSDLAARAGMTKQAMGEHVAYLEERGYVTRERDPADRRARLVRLTPRGWDCIAAGRAAVHAIEREWAERYGERRVRALRSALEALADAR